MKKISRRDFLAISASACCAAAWGPLSGRTALAQSNGGNGRTLVLLNQFGGNDQLNSFAIPYIRNAYYDLRPGIAIPSANVLTLDQGIGLNPILSNLHGLFLDGDLAVIQAVGDPAGTRSHFTSQEYFSRGIIDSGANTDHRGWVGRLGDLYFSDTPFNTFGIGVGQQLDFSSDRSTYRPIVTPQLSSFGFDNDWGVNSRENDYRRAVVQALASREKQITGRKKSARAAQKALYDSLATIQDVLDAYTSPITYPDTSTGDYFRDAATLIQSDLVATRVTYGGLGGWDTHANQVGGHEFRLGLIDDAVGAFVADLKDMNKWNETVICIFTEFGRVNFENASGGTDHAKGGAMVMIGGAVNGGVYGPTPSEAELTSSSYINMDIDFRNVFSEIITWLGYDPAPVFPEPFSQVQLNLI